MVTKETLQKELSSAIRSKDALIKNTLRLVIAAIKLAEVDKRQPLDEQEILKIIQKEVKSCHETISDARKADREDLIENAQAELAILQTYLPQPLNSEELDAIIKIAIEETGASAATEIGKVMKVAIPRIQGRADGKLVSQRVRELLS